MSRMFKSITGTWNVFVGCLFNCIYCNARKAAETRFRHIHRYRGGFNPHLVLEELGKTFKPDEFILACYMGDIAFANLQERQIIASRAADFPNTRFLFQSKDPRIFWGTIFTSQANFVLGTTLETNRNYNLTNAPNPLDRYIRFWSLLYPHKFVSIEPIMDFDPKTLTRWIGHIKPEIIEVGADNYHNNLPEPSPDKLEHLLANLRQICPNVIEKDGLDRLKKRK